MERKRKYAKEEIKRLAEEYIKSGDDDVFSNLLNNQLIYVIKAQLAKKYGSLYEYWDDMETEVVMKLWKNREGIKTTSTKVLYHFFSGRIRRDLFRASQKMKKLYQAEETLPAWVTGEDDCD